MEASRFCPALNLAWVQPPMESPLSIVSWGVWTLLEPNKCLSSLFKDPRNRVQRGKNLRATEHWGLWKLQGLQQQPRVCSASACIPPGMGSLLHRDAAHSHKQSPVQTRLIAPQNLTTVFQGSTMCLVETLSSQKQPSGAGIFHVR